MSHEINIRKNGVYILPTKGKYCDRDTALNVRIAGGEGGELVLQDKSAIPKEERQIFYADAGYDAINKFTVEPIPAGYVRPSGSITITENGGYYVGPLESISVNVPIPDGYIKPSGTLEITESGEYDVTTYAKAVVNVSGGDMVDYSGSQFTGTIGSPTSSFTVALGIELPDKFYFYARVLDTVVSLSSPYIKSFKHSANGEDTIEYYNNSAITTANGAGTMTVSSDRRSITLSNSRQFYSGNWYWTLVMEG